MPESGRLIDRETRGEVRSCSNQGCESRHFQVVEHGQHGAKLVVCEVCGHEEGRFA